MIAGGLDRGNEFDDWYLTLLDLRRWSSLVSLQNVSNGQQTRAGVEYVDATDIADATRKAYELATQGDVVLLSPANASWDMYAKL